MRPSRREASDVGAAGDHRGGAILVEVDRRRRLLTDVEPEPDGNTASGTLDRLGLVVIAGLERFEAFDEADADGHAHRREVTLDCGILESQFDRVHAELACDVVDDRLDGKGGVQGRRRWAAVFGVLESTPTTRA